MKEVEPTGRRGRNGNEAVTGAALQAFARWLHHRYAPVELPSAGHVVSPYQCYSQAIGWEEHLRNQLNSVNQSINQLEAIQRWSVICRV